MTATIKMLVCAHAKRAIRVLGASLALLLISLPLFSQANQGTIQGGVYDQTGGTIAGATVTVVDVARGVSRPLTSDSAGAYVAPNLIPGMYTVRGEAKGFQTLERSNVLLEVGQTVRVDLVLQPGAQTQTITVTSEAPAVNTTDAVLGGTVSNQTLLALPMNGRDFKNFLSLRPGVTAIVGGGIDTWSSNGTRAEDVGYLIDGLRADESYTGQSLVNSNTPSGGSSTGLPLDAIQEINNQQNPKAEVGWKPGAIINVGIKSGTNTLHGTAFAFGRDTSFDARNYFQKPSDPKEPVQFEQFGGSVGGRILKDKLFWFADYEGQRYSVGIANAAKFTPTVSLGADTSTGPNTGNAKVSLFNACHDLLAQGIGISVLSARLIGLDSLTGPGTGPGGPNTVFTGGSCAVAPQNYTPGATFSPYPTLAGNTGATALDLGLVSVNQEDNGIAKMDYHVNDHNTINGEYFYALGNGDFAGALGLPGSSNSPFSQLLGPIQPQLVSGAWNWAPSSTRVNEFRVGFNRYHQSYVTLDDAQGASVNPLAYGINTGVTDPRIFGMPGVTISGATTFGGGQAKLVGPDGSLQLLDHFSLVHGAHTFKFGGEFLWNYVTVFSNRAGKGTFKFADLEGFLQGIPNPAGNCCTIQAGQFTRHLRNEEYALFAQDDWRVTRKVIVNLGLRWEYNSVLSETNNQLGGFDPTRGLVQVGNQVSSPYPGDFKDFSPRVGLAWDIRGNGRTVLRAGGSLMYSYLPIIDFNAVGQALGITQVPTGATIVTAGACAAGCPGAGNMLVSTQNLTSSQIALQTNSSAQVIGGWQAQTAACLGTTTCGPVFPASSFKFQCGDHLTTKADPNECIVATVDPNFHTPWIATWSLSIQQAFTNNLSLDVAYVGTHGGAQPRYVDINPAALGSGYTALQIAAGDPSAASAAAEQKSRPFYTKFPYLSYIDQLTNIDRSNYHALQVTLTQRASHGLSFLAGYTYSHALDDASTNSFAGLPLNPANPGAIYGSSDFDIRNRFTFTTTYDLPGRKAPGQMLQGWEINSIVTLNGPQPWTAKDAANDFSGNGEVGNLNSQGGTWNFVGNPSDFNSVRTPIPCWSGTASGALLPGCPTGATLSGAKQALTPPAVCTAAASGNANALAALQSVGCYVSLNGKSALLPPALGTFNDGQRNIFRDSGFRNWDLSVSKNWKFRERLTAQFRAEVFNILNHPSFANPGGIGSGAGFNDASGGEKGQFGCGCVTPDQAAPNPVLGSGANRAMELGLKLIF